MVNLSVDGTVAAGKDRLLKYHKNITKKYQQLRVEENFILFYRGKDVCRYHVNAIPFLDHETMYVTFYSEKTVCSLTFNSVGIEANFSIVKTYNESWLKISEIEIMNKQLIVSHNGDVSLIDFDSNAVSQILSAQFLPKYLAAYKDDFLFTSKHCTYFWKTSGSASYCWSWWSTIYNQCFLCPWKTPFLFLKDFRWSYIVGFLLWRNVVIKAINDDGLPNSLNGPEGSASAVTLMLHKNAAMGFKEA